MSRALSLTFRQAIFAQETDEAFLILLTIDHASFTAPIRVGSDSVDVVSNGNTFLAFPFNITLPSDTDDEVPSATLSIDAIDQSVITALRAITSPPTVNIQVVLASDPDTVEVEWSDFDLVNVVYNILTIQGKLVFRNFLMEPYPGDKFTPTRFPGLF